MVLTDVRIPNLLKALRMSNLSFHIVQIDISFSALFDGSFFLFYFLLLAITD